ncbi:MAG TPA: 2,3-bisphosphoglycerate-independent phosphoglycerate mutase [Candidatus Thermoplasmatota archaeon]|nr:2,3-bisphosphoglycerate-independent phosphoglycerate mutase [Candidatus Thermoplasmatota archaeon]
MSPEGAPSTRRRVLLCILDGWGIGTGGPEDAFAAAKAPTLKGWLASAPVARLSASGRSVGLPDGVMGNSEVGHLAMGSGRAVDQDLVRIDEAIAAGALAAVPALAAAFEKAKVKSARLHLLGLLSDGGVHSHERHLHALLSAAAAAGVPRVYVHAVLDGRDTPPRSAGTYVDRLRQALARAGTGRIATVGGRYYAMDRDKRWDRVKLAHDALVAGRGLAAADAAAALAEAYARGEDDEFVKPTVLDAEGTLRDGDVVVLFNFRPDRARQVTRALAEETFGEFERLARPRVHIVTMTRYDASYAVDVAFPPQAPRGVVGEVVAGAGLLQLRIAETEKYAHVTYFFNGGREEPFAGERRILVPSRRVATYDLVPEMSAREITAELRAALAAPTPPDLVVLNFANMDMVGHTGHFAPAVAACEAVDACLAELVPEARARGYDVLVTADHGNVEKMRTADGVPHTAHTESPVPAILLSDGRARLRPHGELGDVGPTVLSLLGLPIPLEMTTKSLLLPSANGKA